MSHITQTQRDAIDAYLFAGAPFPTEEPARTVDESLAEFSRTFDPDFENPFVDTHLEDDDHEAAIDEAVSEHIAELDHHLDWLDDHSPALARRQARRLMEFCGAFIADSLVSDQINAIEDAVAKSSLKADSAVSELFSD